MSRIGKQPIIVPSSVTVTIEGSRVHVKGPKGELERTLHANVMVDREGDHIVVTVKDPDNTFDRGLWGLSRVLVSNMVNGVTEGFSKKLEISGIGFKALVQGSKLVLSLGFSHPVEKELPKNISVLVEKNVMTISGIDKEQVGHFAAALRELKKPEPYKGKGIKYATETVRRKAGKAAKAVGGAK
ncbi:MAG TPA: 50S ribosomal protein L6 [Patescibacteria group bacterium]|nr:50S ribosomal protein L6 [Patescibacteria group bacterium]